MSTPETELRAASDTLLSTLDRLFELEAQKRQLLPDDPRMLELADEVEGLAAQVLQVASVQSNLSETAHVMAMIDDPDSPTRPIEASHRPPHDILREWRAAERALIEAPSGSAEAADALLDARELRAEYQRAFHDAQRKVREN